MVPKSPSTSAAAARSHQSFASSSSTMWGTAGRPTAERAKTASSWLGLVCALARLAFETRSSLAAQRVQEDGHCFLAARSQGIYGAQPHGFGCRRLRSDATRRVKPPYGDCGTIAAAHPIPSAAAQVGGRIGACGLPSTVAVVPRGCLRFAHASEEELDHEAVAVAGVGHGAVPEVVVDDGHRSGPAAEGLFFPRVGLFQKNCSTGWRAKIAVGPMSKLTSCG